MISRLFGKKAPVAPDARPTVAILDDDRDLCHVMAEAVRPLGFDFVMAHDGITGLELIRSRRPKLVLLDIMMPGMNGYDILVTMQKDADLSRIPVIVISAVDDDNQFSEEEWTRRLGVVRYLAKPFDPVALAELIQKLLPPLDDPQIDTSTAEPR